jgi:hypothetical protein
MAAIDDSGEIHALPLKIDLGSTASSLSLGWTRASHRWIENWQQKQLETDAL